MREIKFRAWDKENKKMIYSGENEETQCWDVVWCSYFDMLENCLSNDMYIWMQYTGLLDKNGKEIYEGDIVDVVVKKEYNVFGEETQIVRATIVWDEMGKWTFKGNFKSMGFPYSLGHYEYEVIGNIYQNKDLLK